MKWGSIIVLSLSQLRFARLLTAITLPSLGSSINATLVQVPDPSPLTPGFLTHRRLRLAFDSFGRKIPEAEVAETLTEANRAISSFVNKIPDQQIPDNHFEFRHESGGMLLMINAYAGEEIIWGELARIIAAVHRFMIGGVGVTDEHCNSLEFFIETLSPKRIGFGLVWYFPPEDKTQRRDLSSSGVTADGIASQLTTGTSPGISTMEIPYPIPDTSDTLIITGLGVPIPRTILEEALYLCQAQVDDHVRSEIFNPLPGRQYHFFWKGITIAFSCHNVSHEEDVISWGQLRDFLEGLRDFVEGMRSRTVQRYPHYRAIDFVINVEYFGRIVQGYLSYDQQSNGKYYQNVPKNTEAEIQQKGLAQQANGLKVEKRKPNTTTVPFNLPVQYRRLPIPIEGENMTVSVISLGSPIPSFAIEAALTNALRKIQPFVNDHAQTPITRGEFWYRDKITDVWFHLMVSSRRAMTWEQLSRVLAGLLKWMKGDRCRELFFEVNLDSEGFVASGQIGYDPLPAVTKEASGDIQKRTQVFGETQPVKITHLSSTDDCFEIADMGTEVCIKYFGPSIPPNEVFRMFNGAFAKIQHFREVEPEDRVPHNLFQYTEVFSSNGNRISLVIQGDPRATIVWLGLYKILRNLWMYMKGTRPRVPNQGQHFQALRFDLLTFGKATMGSGFVWYTPEIDANEVAATR